MQIDISGVTCYLGIPVLDGRVDIEFFNGVVSAAQMGVEFDMGEQLGISIVQHARNLVAHGFLTQSKAQKLIFIDTDIGFKGQDLCRLIAMSTMYPVAGAMYRTKEEKIRFTANPHLGKDGKVIMNQYGHVKMQSMPLGFSIIDRSVFDLFSDFPKYRNPVTKEMMTDFFRVYVDNHELVGEDIDFCNQCFHNNKEIWCDPDIELEHFGRKGYKASFREALINQKLLES